MLHYLAVASLTSYIISTILFMLAVLGFKATSVTAARIFFYLALALQTILILPVFSHYNSAIPESRGEYLFWFAWAISVIYIAAGKHSNYPVVGAFVAPFAAFFLSASSYLSHMQQVASQPADKSIFLYVHVLPAFLSELCLVLALIVSSIYLIQSIKIKRKISSAITTPAPSLVKLENANQKVLTMGFIAMTVAIVTGVLWGLSSGEVIFSKDLSQWIALLVWIVIAFLLHARTNLQWSASRTAKLTVCLALLVVCSMVGLVFIQGNLIHEI